MPIEQIHNTAFDDNSIASHAVLRNTYFLLSLTLLFSAVCAYFSFINHARFPGVLVFLIGSYGLLFLTSYLSKSAWGLVSIFGFTGFMGYILGPLLQSSLKLPNGANLVATALGMTGLIFFSLSAVVLLTRKDFGFLTNFLFAGFIALLGAMVISIFWHVPALYLAISAGFAIFASLMIIFETSQIIHGGQTNYILATINLYVAIYNLFTSLLSIFGMTNER